MDRTGIREMIKCLSRLNHKNMYMNDFLETWHKSDDEIAAVQQYLETGGVTGEQAAADLAWALINTKEFLYRH